MASVLGEFLPTTLFEPEHGYEWLPAEREELESFLGELEFQSLAGIWVRPGQLLCDTILEGNEPRRAAIAPDDRLLHMDYVEQGDGLEFFKLCRGELEVGPRELADWIEGAMNGDDEQRSQGAIDYLSNPDDLSSSVSSNLEDDTINSILGFPNLDPEQTARVRNTITIGKVQRATERGEAIEIGPNAPPAPPIQPGAQIQAVLNCWEEHGHHAVRDFTISGNYRSLVFQGDQAGDDEVLANLLGDTATDEQKEAWFRFLCLGSSLSVRLGNNPFPRIHQFWQWLDRHNYWEQGIDTNFETVFQNIQGHEEAEFRRRAYYDFQKMRHLVYEVDLPGWVLEFARNPEVKGEELLNFLRTGELPGNLHNANLRRIQGTIGQSMSAPLLFVMRELRRLNIIQHNRFDHACYYVNSPVRKVMSRLGWIQDQLGWPTFETQLDHSRTCHEELSIYQDFNGHFDLPLQCYAKYGEPNHEN